MFSSEIHMFHHCSLSKIASKVSQSVHLRLGLGLSLRSGGLGALRGSSAQHHRDGRGYPMAPSPLIGTLS